MIVSGLIFYSDYYSDYCSDYSNKITIFVVIKYFSFEYQQIG